MALAIKNLPVNVGDVRDVGSFSGSGRFPGGGQGNPLQYPCLENSVDRGAWQAPSPWVHKSRTRLSTCTQQRTVLFMEGFSRLHS